MVGSEHRSNNIIANDSKHQHIYPDLGCGGKTLRFLLVICTIVSFVLSLSALGSCQFMSYTNSGSIIDRPIDDIPNDDEFITTNTTISYATLGFLNWNPNRMGCQRYGSSSSNLSVGFQISRAMALLASLCSLFATINICIEVICCRCCCSRCSSTSTFVFMAIFHASSFSMYTTNICLSSSSDPYGCRYASGSSLAISAIIFAIISAMLSCSTPKARPLVRLLMELDHNQENDPCCYCFRKDTIHVPSSTRPNKVSSKSNDDDIGTRNNNKNDKNGMNTTNDNIDDDFDNVHDNDIEYGPMQHPLGMNTMYYNNNHDNNVPTEHNFVGQQIVIPSSLDNTNHHPPSITAASVPIPNDNDVFYSMQQPQRNYGLYNNNRQQQQQQPYYATPLSNDHTRIRNAPYQTRIQQQQQQRNPSKSYLNGEIVDDDLFFDSKTI